MATSVDAGAKHGVDAAFADAAASSWHVKLPSGRNGATPHATFLPCTAELRRYLLQDGVVPAPGSQNDAQQYDTYTGDGGVEAQSIGYSFDSMQMLTKLTYTEGMHFSKPGILSFAPGSPTAATKACCLQTTAAGGPRRRWWR